MYYIFMDEAGTSRQEPHVVVVGILVEDQQRAEIETAFRQLIENVPAIYRDDFIFHATDIWSGNRFKEHWTFEQRRELIKDVLALGVRFKLSVAWGVTKREAGSAGVLAKIRRPTERIQHVIAFIQCMWATDLFIRRFLPGQTGQFVAEDVPEVRRDVRLAIQRADAYRLRMRGSGIRALPKAAGDVMFSGELAFTVVSPEVRFVKKGEEPLSELADAFAFAIRRFLSGKSHGEELLAASGISARLLAMPQSEMSNLSCVKLGA